MARETELKLRVAPEQMNRLRRHPLLKSLSSTRAVTRVLHNVYYDTPDLYFHRNEVALRLRRIGRKWLQTLKGGGGVQAGLHSRDEWETPVRGPALELDALEAQGAMRVPDAVRDKLQPIFVTDFSRTSRNVIFEGAEIEVSLDSGEIRAGDAARPISELELELKSGKPLQLFRLALALLDRVPLEIESTSKAEYGYRLYAGIKPVVAEARAPALSRSMSVSDALQSMIWSCLQHLQASVPAGEYGLDADGVCRLRIVLVMVARHRGHGDELAVLRRELAVLGAELDCLHAWDVFLAQAKLPLHAGQVRRQWQQAIVQRKLQQDFQRLLLRFGAWMVGPYWQGARTSDACGISDFAAQILQQCSRRFEKLRTRLGMQEKPASTGALQVVRNKLEYCAEVFCPLHAAPEAARMLAALDELNGVAAAYRLLRRPEVAAHQELAEELHRWLEQEWARSRARFNQQWRRPF